MQFEVNDFQLEVLEASKNLPVVVDFWAPWCGPCQVLGPIIEKLAQSEATRWKLVKVNVDQHPDISRQFGIRSIPAVKMFVDGQVKAEFTGALPEGQIRKWLNDHIPSASDKLVQEAIQLAQEGQQEAAAGLLEKVLKTDPSHAVAAFHLARLWVFGHPKKAVELLAIAKHEPKNLIFVESLETMAHMLASDPEQLEEGMVKPMVTKAIAALRAQQFEQALEQFIEALGIQKAYHQEISRKACIAIFHYLGEQNPLTLKYRRRFNSALY